MRKFGKMATETQRTEHINFAIVHPVTHEDIYGVTIDKVEARDAIDWLREHNGHAPEFVHAFIKGMEIALGLQWDKRF